MCGIVGVVRRRARRTPPDLSELLRDVARAHEVLGGGAPTTERLDECATALVGVDTALRGAPGVRALLDAPDIAAELGERLDGIETRLRDAEAALDLGAGVAVGGTLEALNAALIRCRDAVWAVRHDRLGTARAVAEFAPSTPAAVEGYLSIVVALSALDRLEVRGRDSAGLHVLVRGHDLDTGSAELRDVLEARSNDPLFPSGSVRVVPPYLSFVYKAAAEIGELGDNTAVLRAAIQGDELLQRALSGNDAEAVVLGHTRWASVGGISEANAHPLNQEELADARAPYVVGVLNGDVDNHADLINVEDLEFAPEITTDAKVIPVLVSRRIATGASPDEAFRATVASLEGSLAIAAQLAAAPDQLFLSLRGSGQALYVGLAEDAFVVAS